MKIRDLLEFQRQKYFNGAIQTEWFYQPEKRQAIADSYVFHGPKYYGVSERDVQTKQHQLMDTASFATNLAEKLSSKQPENCFLMTIAGYGTGKSHLAVTLGALFSHLDHMTEQVTEHIRLADEGLGTKISQLNTKPNLVIALNGMNNFNLDYEVLQCASKALKAHGLQDTILRNLNKTHATAKRFVETAYQLCESRFVQLLNKSEIEDAKAYLLEYLAYDAKVFQIVDQVYEEVNGEPMHWERGISAGDILNALASELCGEDKPFQKVLILFDEFGRYIEYAAANPTVAGDAALQQIFETTQSSNGNVIFVGFIQSDLSSYLSRIEKTANIVRYVGRYDSSEKLYLSSNFETILANLIHKKDDTKFQSIVNHKRNLYHRYYSQMSSAINRWDRTVYKKCVWSNEALYKQVVLQGCYPMHPITVWFLANTSQWMQQRSTITFAAEMFEKIADEVLDGDWLPHILPVDIVDSNIYQEMLNSEEKGLIQSQYCMLYRDIITKVGDKLREHEQKLLKAALIINVSKFIFRDKEDTIQAIQYCTNLGEKAIAEGLKSLEFVHGVLSFDENSHTFDFIAEANGINEFKRTIMKYFRPTAISIEDYDDDMKEVFELERRVETSFAQDHSISSIEWSFEKVLLDVSSITKPYLQEMISNISKAYSGEKSRGLLIYGYAPNDSADDIQRISMIVQDLQLELHPIIILLLRDPDGDILKSLHTRKTLQKFSSNDYTRLQKHVEAEKKAGLKKMSQKFSSMIISRNYITGNGVESYQNYRRLNIFCSKVFERIYPKAPAFVFDGFEKKNIIQARKYFNTICLRLFDKTLMNIQSYQALTQDEKNRVKGVLAVGNQNSWQVLTQDCSLILPKNQAIRDVYQQIDNKLQDESSMPFWSIFGLFTTPPYGMNIYEITLFFFYYVAQKSKQLKCFYGDERLTANHINEKILKQNKLQTAELFKIQLQKSKPNQEDEIPRLCNVIMENQFVEQEEFLRNQLNTLTMEEGIAVEHELVVAQAKQRLDYARRIYQDLRHNQKEAQNILEQSETRLQLNKVVKIFKYFPTEGAVIVQGYPFVYSNSYLAEFDKIKATLKILLDGQGARAVEQINCDITQLSQVKATCKSVSIALTDNGYVPLATSLATKIDAMEKELLAKQKYESSIIECRRIIDFSKNVSQMSYEECSQKFAQLEEWRSFFDAKIDLPQSVCEDLFPKLDKIQATLAGRKEAISNRVEDALNMGNRVKNSGDLQKHLLQMETLLQLALPEHLAEKIMGIMEKIQIAQDKIKEMPTQIDVLEQEIDTIDQDIYGNIAVRYEYKTQLSTIQKKENEWIKKYLQPVFRSVQRMNALDCSNWFSATKNIPDFLREAVIQQYRDAYEQVEKQMQNNRVQGVVKLFKGLTVQEKEECLRLILKK